jgi:hypothetical protein
MQIVHEAARESFFSTVKFPIARSLLTVAAKFEISLTNSMSPYKANRSVTYLSIYT